MLGQDDKAAEATERSGRPGGARLLFGTDWANAADGLRMTTPTLLRPEPGVLVAQGYDFGDFAFITTAEGVIAIDAGTAEHRRPGRGRRRRASRGGTKITHVILTHAHFDHVGGIGALLGPDTTVIAQAGFPAEQDRQRGNHLPFRNFTGETGTGGPPVTPDQLIELVGTIELIRGQWRGRDWPSRPLILPLFAELCDVGFVACGFVPPAKEADIREPVTAVSDPGPCCRRGPGPVSKSVDCSECVPVTTPAQASFPRMATAGRPSFRAVRARQRSGPRWR